MRAYHRAASILLVLALLQFQATKAYSQAFGIELHNTLMPASGAMAGASIARPQDVPSAIYGNPASLSRFQGTQFTFGGSWVEPTFNMAHAGGVLPNIGAFAGKSESEGTALGNIGVSQDLRSLGLPGTMGIALVAAAGAGVSYRDVPASNGTTATLTGLQIVTGAGFEITDRLSLGANFQLGTTTLDGPFTGLNAAAIDYGIRGTAGLNYDLCPTRTLGVYYQTKQNHNFDDMIRLALPGGGFDLVSDINLDLPDNVGLGYADETFFEGRLLLAVDVLYKNWKNADLFRAIYENQWVLQIGAQYRIQPRMKLRLGYALAENITVANPGNSAGGVLPPAGQDAIQYVQSIFPAFNQHRVSAGLGIENVLPGINFDLFGGGMFNASEQFGAFTQSSLETYWLGFGLTWRFGGNGDCVCEEFPIVENLCVE